MTLLDDNPHILGISIEPDPRSAVPDARCAVVETDLDPGTIDDTEREKLAAMVGLVEMHLRAEFRGFTRVILHRRLRGARR
jgi:hypothetical protein